MDPILVALVGWVAAWWLWGRPARLAAATAPIDRRTIVVIPARDEAAVLPLLLGDLVADAADHRRVLVVDDHSTDGTADVARRHHGIEVVAAPELPRGWTGKSWACHQGVLAAGDLDPNDVLVFLDADVRVQPGAIDAAVAELDRRGGIVSVQPFHATARPDEQLSLFPGLVSLMGTGVGRRGGDPTGAFGPLIATSAADYAAAGGHAGVAEEVAEDLALGIAYRDAGLPVAILLGDRLVRFRMYPAGLGQLVEGWTKNMATGAGTVPLHRTLLAVLWITAAGSAFLSLPVVPGNGGVDPYLGAAAYLAFVAQIAVLGRAVGTFGLPTALLYPLPLVGFLAIFVRSVWRLRVRRNVRWRGRTIDLGRAGPHA